MKLNIDSWKEFILGDIFDCETTSPININDAVEGNIPYITRSAINNGLTDYLGNSDKIVKGNCITIGAEGTYAFYQPKDFIPGVKIYTIRHEKLNCLTSMFIVSILNSYAHLYSYGRARVLEKLKKEAIKLPCTKNGDPDWQFMEEYVKSLKYKLPRTKNIKNPKLNLDTSIWKEFIFEDIFDIKRGESLYIVDSEIGKIPYASASSENNAISTYLNIIPNRSGNCLTINYDGSVGDCFYQNQPFFASEKIVTVTFKNAKMTPYNALFVACVIRKEKYRFSYGRKWTVEASMKKSIIKLPVLHNNKGEPIIDTSLQFSKEGYIPDWQFMEDYIKSLPFGDRIK